MRPVFRNRRTEDIQILRQDLLEYVEQIFDIAGAHDLGDYSVGLDEIRIAHGLLETPKRWAAVNPRDFAIFRQTRPPDEKFIFVAASVTTVAGFLVW